MGASIGLRDDFDGPSLRQLARRSKSANQARRLYDAFAVSLDTTTVRRELKRLGYVKLTAQPRHHAQNALAMEAFKNGHRRG